MWIEERLKLVRQDVLWVAALLQKLEEENRKPLLKEVDDMIDSLEEATRRLHNISYYLED